MSEAITTVDAAVTAAPARRLHPGVAFLGGLIGVGYLYVGRIWYAIGFVVAQYVFLFALTWARWPLVPIGFYASLAGAAMLWLAQLVHPIVLAWSRPIAQSKPYNRWWAYAGWVAASVGLSWVLIPDRSAALGYDMYYIPASSMFPTLQPGDRIVADTWRYRDLAPEPGKIVTFQSPDGTLLVKRVVAVPGDTIELRGPMVVRNGNPVDEPYLNLEPGGILPDAPPLTLGADQFFVLGDNRGNSNDSRFMGPVAREQIYGRVALIYFSTAGGGVAWQRFPVTLSAD